MVVWCFDGCSNGRTASAAGCCRHELKLTVKAVLPLELRAGRGEHRSEDPAARTHRQLVDNAVSEHRP